jgi:hypothetical protein
LNWSWPHQPHPFPLVELQQVNRSRLSQRSESTLVLGEHLKQHHHRKLIQPLKLRDSLQQLKHQQRNPRLPDKVLQAELLLLHPLNQL